MYFEVPQDRSELMEWLDLVLSHNHELEIVSAAPVLENPTLVRGIRTLIDAFGWDAREVRGLAFLLYETGSLTDSEAAWLAGFCGDGAPRQPVSPAGG